MIAYLRAHPGFWIAVEELERPELRHSPVIMGGLPRQRGAVREANILAQQRGVRAGMTLAQAHQQCPDGVFLVPDLPRYEGIWRAIHELLDTYTPLVESIGMGQVVCDLSGCERRWREPWEAGSAIAEEVYRYTGIALHAGLASNRFVAQIASSMPGDMGVTAIAAGQEAAFLADLPITLLPDVDPRLALSFQVLGLQTIGQLAALPASAVARRFGPPGKLLHAYARGIDPRPVTPPPTKPSVIALYTCEEGSLEEAMAALQRLAGTCAAELRQRGLVGRMVELALVWRIERTRHPEREGALPALRESVPALPATVQPSLPVPYRIHSMMAQPRREPSSPPSLSTLEVRGEARGARPSEPGSLLIKSDAARPFMGDAVQILKTAVRTAIDTAPPLLEQGQRLLMQAWPRKDQSSLERIELKVSEFEEPVQLGFDTCMRLDQTGGLAGLGPERRRAIARQEQILTARYGDATFRHVAQVDPGSVLTERRFRWGNGLRWAPDGMAGSGRGT
ncbi:MAG: DNA polymerase Y family protein [Chloroflexota bacterium]